MPCWRIRKELAEKSLKTANQREAAEQREDFAYDEVMRKPSTASRPSLRTFPALMAILCRPSRTL